VNTITVVSQLINDARLQHGDVEILEVPSALWEPAMDEVAEAGGEVGLDYCVVDGVQVRQGDADDRARAHIADEPTPRDLPFAG
jgi:hypothetical protein